MRQSIFDIDVCYSLRKEVPACWRLRILCWYGGRFWDSVFNSCEKKRKNAKNIKII